MRYVVEWIERCPQWAEVEADSEEEALEKGKRGDFIENTRDSEPGHEDMRTYRVRRAL
jgi:hypothetical protein